MPSLVFHVVPEIAPARTDYYSYAATVICQIRSHFHLLPAVRFFPNVYLGRNAAGNHNQDYRHYNSHCLIHVARFCY